MKLLKKSTVTVVLLLLTSFCHAQTPGITCYAAMKNLDASKLWYNDNIPAAVDSGETGLPEPLGFIGEKYQRFYIHYTSIIKSKTNPYQYMVQGKTKVKDNTCTFHGVITIQKAALYKKQSEPVYKEGFLNSEVLIKEDSSQNSSGFIKGYMVTKFYLDEKHNIHYDDLMMGADGYFNNQCEAVWTSYKNPKSKRCNWGDYRIPASKILDKGDGEFAVDEKYRMNGWENYMLAWNSDPDKASAKEAQKKELMHWWDAK